MNTRLRIWLKALRVDQWTKNGVVMMAWFFSIADSSQLNIVRGFSSFLLAIAMAGAFSLISSSFYLLNDVSDYENDRMHPVKKLRPIASDLIDKIAAVRVALVLFAIGFAYPALIVILSPRRTTAFATVLAYTVMQCLYTGFLKRIAYVDVATLATGFVLRAIAGAAIIDAYISPWLLICTFTLSLFLACCKRKHEMETASVSRPVLKSYHPKVLASFIVLSGVFSFAEYLIYTLRSNMGHRYALLWVTSVFVALGILRYALLTFRRSGDVGRPEKILLSDRPLWAIIGGYALAAVLVVALK